VSMTPDQGYGIPRGGHSIIRNLASIKAAPSPAGRPHVDRYPFDAEYLRRLREGDPVTVDHFYAYFTEKLNMKLWKGGFPRAVSDDLRQETFTRVLEKLQLPDAIQSPESFGGFVFSVCRNLIFERYRENSRHDQLDDDVLELPAADPDGEQRLLCGERDAKVRRTLKLMKSKDAQILVAVIVEEQPKDDVCARFRVTRPYLRVVLHRAIARFRFIYSSEKG
jgi:RNA polymerase sigma-70 factor, ECF subfamily